MQLLILDAKVSLFLKTESDGPQIENIYTANAISSYTGIIAWKYIRMCSDIHGSIRQIFYRVCSRFFGHFQLEEEEKKREKKRREEREREERRGGVNINNIF